MQTSSSPWRRGWPQLCANPSRVLKFHGAARATSAPLRAAGCVWRRAGTPGAATRPGISAGLCAGLASAPLPATVLDVLGKSKWDFKCVPSAQACVSRRLSLTLGKEMRQVMKAQTRLRKRASGCISLGGREGQGRKGKRMGSKRKPHSSVLLPLLSQRAVRRPRDLAVSHRRHQW